MIETETRLSSRASARRRDADRRVIRARVLPHWPALRAELTNLEARVLALRLGLMNDRR